MWKCSLSVPPLNASRRPGWHQDLSCSNDPAPCTATRKTQDSCIAISGQGLPLRVCCGMHAADVAATGSNALTWLCWMQGSPVSMQGEAALQPSPSPVFGQLLTSILQRFRCELQPFHASDKLRTACCMHLHQVMCNLLSGSVQKTMYLFCPQGKWCADEAYPAGVCSILAMP